MSSSEIDLPADYAELLESLKERVRGARIQAQRTVNALAIEPYWSLGKEIIGRQGRQGWGSGVINRLAADMRQAFPSPAHFASTRDSTKELERYSPA
jgi:hypothetical protein